MEGIEPLSLLTLCEHWSKASGSCAVLVCEASLVCVWPLFDSCTEGVGRTHNTDEMAPH